NVPQQLSKIRDIEKRKVYNLAFLAFLDSMGYAKRVKKSNHKELFKKVLKRYVKTVEDVLENPYFDNKNLGTMKILNKSTAQNLELKEDSIDGIITSPPYSFAIDYVKNDQYQLEFLGYNADVLKDNMIGLSGKNKAERINNYFNDMSNVCSEIHRVLKKGKYFVMIIGSNTNQTGGIRLERKIIDSCEDLGLRLIKSILKPIKGIRNTMKDEFVLFFQKQN
ncbi:MAG: hypothetical protein GF364_06620, partial [Candidatus Lokiarchaeota archaeon]|nr:hypothetical protein [Candidatus Lokiarchaeota archaeon]